MLVSPCVRHSATTLLSVECPEQCPDCGWRPWTVTIEYPPNWRNFDGYPPLKNGTEEGKAT